MTVRITWVDNNVDETGHRVYRSTSPMDPSALPEPIATLAADVTTYVDTTAPADTDCYYRVAAERNGELAVSDQMMINTGTGEVGEPPVEGDVYWDNVVSLLDFTSGLSDAKGLTWSTIGEANAVSVINGSLVNAASSSGAIVTSESLDLSTGDFTIELDIDPDNLSGTRAIYGNYGLSAIQFSNGVNLWISNITGGDLVYTAFAVQQGVNQKFAMTRQGNVYRIFLDGSLKVETTSTAGFGMLGIASLGGRTDGSNPFSGKIDNFRLTQGLARYTADYTPTDGPFPNQRVQYPEPTPDLPTVIGEAFGGGYYAGDIEYPDGQWYKLIVADVSADITGLASRWKIEASSTDGTSSQDDGVINTNAMIAAGSTLHPAGGHCVNHESGGITDWYMPAKDELGVIYQNLGFNRPSCPPDFLAGGPQAFSDNWYWSSTERTSTAAYLRNLNDGRENFANNKASGAYRVRPIRRIAFTPPAVQEPIPTVIGEQIGGGFYIGDITVADGDDAGTYAIIMAGPESQATLAWKTSNNATVGTGSATNGLANTLAMQAADPAIHLAGMYCLNYVGGDHDDWYMPAKNELNLTWVNRANLADLAMEAQWYWSSTHGSSGGATTMDVSSGSYGDSFKNTNFRIRPVRRIKKS